MRIIETEADVAEGAEALAAVCPRLAHALTVIGAPPLRRREDGFAALMQAIVSQQVSVASARAIWGRVEAAGLAEEAAVRRSSDDDLRACGLSRPKIRYAKAIAEAGLDYGALRAVPEEEAVATLTAVKGIGVWTAEIYLMFAVGRADVFAPGDLALRESARALYDLPERPPEPALREMAEAWRPWRSVAARILFAYYHHVKGR
ncbi:MAG: DNA-3-methyladenine glycosylase 2 family protein, partial [Pseudomonadota bacterium]